jgi:hypothetical protein
VLFLLRVSFEILPLLALAPVPILWVSIVLVAVAAVYANHQPPHGMSDGGEEFARGRWVIELGLLVVPPLAMLGCGLYLWQQNSSNVPRAGSSATWILYVLAVLHIALAMWLVWRHRRRLWATFVIAALSTWWALGTLFTASMAATDTWL